MELKLKLNVFLLNQTVEKKTSVLVKKYLQKREKIQKEADKKFKEQAKKSCKPGYIKRSGYKISRENSKDTWIPPKCIKSPLGRSTKGKKDIVILEKGVLEKYGYENVLNLTELQRHRALKKAIKKIKPLSVYRRILAIATLNKNKDPKLSKILKNDAEWIKIQKEYIENKASNKKTSKKTLKKGSKK